MDITRFYIKTIFCCMACDGDIAEKEEAVVKELIAKHEIFHGLDIQTILNEYITLINEKGQLFLREYLKELDTETLQEEEQLKIVDFAIQVIYADEEIQYNEVKFFKKIRRRLSLTDEQILTVYPDIEDFLLPDIYEEEDMEWENNIVFNNINLDKHSQ